MFIAFIHATFCDSSSEIALSITTLNFADICMFSLLMEVDELVICFSKRTCKYADIAIETGPINFHNVSPLTYPIYDYN